MNPLRAALILLIGFLISGCASSEVRPEKRDAISARKLAALLERLSERRDAFHSFLLVRNGKPDVFWNAPGFDTDTPQPLFSVTKSVVSLLCGIAVSEGLLKPEDPVYRFFPSFTNLTKTTGPAVDARRLVTVGHLLTMQSGLQWDEDGPAFTASQASRLDRVLSLPLASPPGEVFCYHNGAAHLLGAIVAEASGLPLQEYAESRLFRPLGIVNWKWERDFDGTAYGDTGLRLSPRDLAKIGEMCLSGGDWHGKRVAPQVWLERATKRQVAGWPYGYLWWVNPFGGFRAQGRYGQYLIVLPAQRAVIVFTGGLPDTDIGLPLSLVRKWLVNY